ncbi:DUF5719 family protein [uncultured Schumannella sp.]|uniref:DUF5719 family protein n=1 Tax=uncultured Schumannella sp. TaxID=1195956 RepID=UPI0025E41528|nr:DUF5719 family protein [uncultured Schumannella sp.]
MPDLTQPDSRQPEGAQPDRHEPGAVRRAVRVGGRIAGGTAALVLAVAVVAGVGFVRLPTLGAAPAGIAVTPEPSDQLRVCTGGLVRFGDETGGNAETAVAVSGSELVADAIGALLGETDLGDPGINLDGADAAPVVITAPAGDGVLIAGATAQSSLVPGFSGLAASPCVEPSGSTWLVGGSLSVGRSTALVLTNPSDVDAEVTLRLWGETGILTAPGLSGISVPAGAQRVVSLAGFAPGIASPVLEVAARGGRITATLQQSIVRGLDDGGVEVIGATEEPNTSLVIPGVRIEDSLGVSRASARADWEDAIAAIRLLVPGEVAGSATVRVVPESEPEEGVATDTALEAISTFVLELEPQRVVEIDLGAGIDAEELSALPDGIYTVYVDADVPVVAAARATTAVDEGAPDDESALDPVTAAPASDFAWFAAAPALPSELLVAVATAPQPVLSLVNPTAADQTVSVEVGGAAVTEYVVPAGASISRAVTAGAVIRLSGAAGLQAALSYADPGELASGVLLGSRPLAEPITVYP